MTPKEYQEYQQKFDKKLLQKVGNTSDLVKQKESLQKMDADVIMGPFERNSSTFKDQFHRRLLQQSKIFEHQSKSPEKNHAVYEVERAQRLIDQANHSMMNTEHVRDEKINKQK